MNVSHKKRRVRTDTPLSVFEPVLVQSVFQTFARFEFRLFGILFFYPTAGAEESAESGFF